jgi:hypothetical protein
MNQTARKALMLERDYDRVVDALLSTLEFDLHFAAANMCLKGMHEVALSHAIVIAVAQSSYLAV